MIRILLYLVLVFLVGLGFAWLAERPGDMVITFGGYRYEVSLMVAAIMVAAAIAAVMIAWWLVRGLWNSPYAITRYFRVRQRDRGYQALSTGMIAAGAGDGGLARRMGHQAGKLIASEREPLLHLLEAQAAMLEGDHERARRTFAAMLDDPETRLLGLRGLYLEARRLGETEAARHYAAQAAEKAPQLGWALEATLEAKGEDGDWAGALALLDRQKPVQAEDREALARRRAVLMTARAMETLDADPASARADALEAHRLRPDFVPAATVAARALFRQGDLRRGSKVLETAWKHAPHPDVAETYVHARPGDSTHDRLERAVRLRRLRTNNVESELAVARAALEAGELAQARAAAGAAVRLAPREGAFLLLADIEEAETGDQGRVRHWLAKAVRAPRDPAWVAGSYVSENWGPVSPVTGELDAFEWRAPMERLGQVIEGDEALEALPAPEPEAPFEAPQAESRAPTTEESAEPVETDEQDTPEQAADTREPEAAEGPIPDRTPGEERAERETADDEERQPPIPDDPGIDRDKAERESATRFRLF